MRGKREKIPLREAERLAERILKEIKKFPEVDRALVAGSIRRKKPEVKDIDLVIETKKPEQVTEKFSKMKFVKTILAKGNVEARIITKGGVQVDLRVFEHASFGSGLMHCTGSKPHNIGLRKIAKNKGLKLNEYGLFKNNKQIAGKTEKGIYALLGFKFIKPEKREVGNKRNI